MKRPIRVVVAKAGLDGHDRGAKVVARALRDAGMEVIYTGVHQTPEQVVETALQEDADAIGLSLLSGAHNYIFPRVSELMKEKGMDDVLLFGGGIIPEADWPALSKVGVEKVFPPGASLEEITKYVREAVSRKRGTPRVSIGENPSSRQPVERGVGEQRDNEIANDVKKARGTKMAKKDDRPIDAGLAALVGKSEQELIDFWKQRFGLISAIPIDTARVGALTPQLRELVRIENREERKRLTAARMKAFVQLPSDQQERITKTREAAYNIDRGVLEEDQRMVDELRPTIPEAKSYPTAAR